MKDNNFIRHTTRTENLQELIAQSKAEDITIDIFCESLGEYLEKMKGAFAGRYELDHYDTQVLGIAMDQCIY